MPEPVITLDADAAMNLTIAVQDARMALALERNTTDNPLTRARLDLLIDRLDAGDTLLCRAFERRGYHSITVAAVEAARAAAAPPAI